MAKDKPPINADVITQKGITLERLQQLKPLSSTSTLTFAEVKPYRLSKRLDFLNLPEYRVIRKGTTVLGGEASSGKTTLALQIALDVLIHQPESSLLFFSLDESMERARRKVLSLLLALQNLLPKDKSGKRYNLAHQPLTPELEELLQSPKQQKILSRIYITDDAYFLDPAYDGFLNMIAHMPGSPVLVVVDYLQLLPKAGFNGNLRENFNATLAYLKKQVNQINDYTSSEVMLLLLSQVSRATQQQSTFSFRETSEIENMADSALVLEYAAESKSQSTGRGKEKVISLARALRLIKNKDGAKANFQVIMASDIPFFTELSITGQRYTQESVVFRVGTR